MLEHFIIENVGFKNILKHDLFANSVLSCNNFINIWTNYFVYGIFKFPILNF